MNKTGKSKVLKVVIIVVCCVALVGGIVFALSIVKKNNQNKKEALVVSVSSISDDPSYYGSDSSSYEGSVTVSTTQKVYLTSVNQVAELCVTEGQSVKAGDLILKYDMTEQQLQLDAKKASVDTANNSVTQLQRALKKLQETTPVEEQPQVTVVDTATDSDANYDDLQDDDSDDDGMVYTKAELAEAISSKETEIRDAKVSAALEEVAYEIMLAQNQSSELYCNFDGVVTSIIDADTAVDENKPYITISGNEGMTVQCYVGEYSLANLHIGDDMSLYCYDTGMTYAGTVSDIGTIPDEDRSSYGAAQSYYPVEIAVPDAGDLTQGMYLEVTPGEAEDTDYDTATESSASSDVFTIPLQFVRKEDGKRYVMKDENGRLVKTYVSTGKIYWGYEIEITGGLTKSDYVAFPYLEDSVEGVKTKQTTVDELYGY